jgi:predicted nucleic acid-binding protein
LKYILDTNIISELIRENPDYNVVSFVDSLPEEHIYLSVITIGEIYFGIQKLQDGKKKNGMLAWFQNDLLQRFDGKILEIDTHTMVAWGEINASLKASGAPMPIMDSLIAATCKAGNHTLVTRNIKDFVRLDIALIDPFVNNG